MTIYTCREPDNWGDCFSPALISLIAPKMEQLSKLCAWYEKNLVRFNVRITSYDILRELGVYMPRKKQSNGGTTNNHGNSDSGSRGGTKWVWANIHLENEDIEYLSQSDSTMEFLATSILALGDDGIGVTVKPVDNGKSICCTLYRPDSANPSIIIGVSSFGGTVRDALMVALYKLDEKLGGEFDNASHFTQDTGERPRFR